MKPIVLTLTAAACVCALVVPAALAKDEPAGRPGKVFPLERKPLPDWDTRGARWRFEQLVPLRKMPAGVEAAEAHGGTMAFGKDNARRCQVVLARSSERSKYADRLYVDANGNGQFEKGESYDLSRSAGPIQINRSSLRYRRITANPLELTLGGAGSVQPYWIALLIYDYPGQQSHFRYASATCAAGRVTVGKKDFLLGVYDTAMSEQFDRCPTLSDGKPDTRGRMPSACQLLVDTDGNGRFDSLNFYGMGSENRWLTRYLRLGGVYYELEVDAAGRSIRVAPATPKLGTMKIPKEVESASVVGPAFAAVVVGADKQIELPAGDYAVYEYTFRQPAGSMQGYDREGTARLAIQPGEAATLAAGPPLTVKVDCQSRSRGRSSRELALDLALTDCAGRRVVSISDARGKRPPAPRFTVVTQGGKTILDAAFKYG